ncbi:putative bifunctional diguanylate cyclase/phosphodiesterase [Mycolicibacterium sp. 050158]|uniref:putative bifunctional diguanylate cyclase/phosphodiesterase n=1 Tax=Mycolicibacterium sp. 050158 TaxID=3090602 RepID=UPI00299EE577|nr:EAL domain-containing protein [Mycolicibacterium sp. 050158]MDX1889612.1 EAL domain-containing protein [Mycolicibacterium sp. 050158]
MTCALVAAFSSGGRKRAAWLCMTAGTAGWVLANLYWAYFEIIGHHEPHTGTIADVGFLALPIGAWLAATLGPPSDYGRFSFRAAMDGLIAASSLFIVAWALVLRDLVNTGRPQGVAVELAVAYPVVDIAVITMCVLHLFRSRGRQRLVFALGALGLGFIAVSDMALIYVAVDGVRPAGVAILGWSVGACLLGFSALFAVGVKQSRAQTPRVPTARSLWLPYLPVPFALIIGTASMWRHPDDLAMFVAGLALILTAFLRQFVLLTDNRRLLLTVADMALRDPLTGLANRALFGDRLTHALQLRDRTGAPVAVLLADLDDFKLVNDSMGHPVGDELLRSVGERIQAAVRPGDTVARLGGDEFAILVEDAPMVARQLVERVVRSFDEPFSVAGHTVYTRVSLGLATAVGDATISADELFNWADLAMYSAKRAHAGARSFTPDMRRDATEMYLPSQQRKTGRRAGVSRIQFLGELRQAIADRQLDLVYQPKLDLSTGDTVGVEALIRWPHPELGLLEPADFLPLVRENGLMEDVTDFVLERAVEDAAGWQRAGHQLSVAINLSAPSLNDDELPARVLSVLARHGLSPALLTVEITEDLLLASLVRARTILDRLRESGVRVAIDDFGSGYAGMTYLHELPIDELKLDRGFIAPVLSDERAATIVRSVVELAAKFGLTSVAEGVENAATAELLTGYGCDLAQGNHFSPPVSAQVIQDSLHVTTPRSVAGVTSTAAVRPSWA